MSDSALHGGCGPLLLRLVEAVPSLVTHAIGKWSFSAPPATFTNENIRDIHVEQAQKTGEEAKPLPATSDSLSAIFNHTMRAPDVKSLIGCIVVVQSPIPSHTEHPFTDLRHPEAPVIHSRLVV